MSTNAISDVTKKYDVNIKGKCISPHKLRATYGTMLYNKTKDLYFVQKSMGHSSPATTQLYVRDENDRTTEIAANIIEDILN